MSERHPVHYLVEAIRNNLVVHAQTAETREEAEQLRERFERAPHTHGEITEVHDPAETDLTTHTREIVEDIARTGRVSTRSEDSP